MGFDSSIKIISIILLVVLAGVVVPTFLDSSGSNTAEDTQIYQVNESVTVNQNLEVYVHNVDQSVSRVEVTDTTNAETDIQNIEYGATATYEFTNGNVTVTPQNLGDTQRVALTVQSNTTYGWGEGEKDAHQYTGYMLVIPVFIVLIIGFWAVISHGGDDR